MSALSLRVISAPFCQVTATRTKRSLGPSESDFEMRYFCGELVEVVLTIVFDAVLYFLEVQSHFSMALHHLRQRRNV